MEALKEAAVAGERKAVTSRRFSLREAKRLRRAGKLQSRGWRNRLWGSGTANRPVLSNAVFSAVHDGGGQCWESGHLEPFFCASRHAGSGPPGGRTALTQLIIMIPAFAAAGYNVRVTWAAKLLDIRQQGRIRRNRKGITRAFEDPIAQVRRPLRAPQAL